MSYEVYKNKLVEMESPGFEHRRQDHKDNLNSYHVVLPSFPELKLFGSGHNCTCQLNLRHTY